MLAPYLPIVFLFALATAFAGFSVAIAPFTGPQRYNQAKLDFYECGIEPTPQPLGPEPLSDQVLPDGDAVHRLRHRDHLLVPVRGREQGARAVRAGRDDHCSSSRCSSPTPTSGAAADWIGTRAMGLEEKLPDGVLLASVEKLVNWTRKSSLWPAHVRPGLLRDRDDDLRRPALRLGPLRHGGLPALAAPGRPDDRRRPGQPEDGPGAAPDLRPDGRAEWVSRWASAPARAACSTTTRSCRASTTSCRSTCTCRAARPGRRC